ncbi:unnamed protein product [Rotaria sp. Silwood2]|nr:unnamed protein product [Rotaria sp. Silwood2]
MSSNSTSSNTIALLNSMNVQLNRYLPLPFLILGTIGVILNIIIFTRRSLVTNSCTHYLLGNTVANFIILYWVVITRIFSDGYKIDPSITSDVFCKMRYFLTYVPRTLSTWFILLACIDRWASSIKIQRRFNNVPFARTVIVITTIICIVSFSNVLIYFGVQKSSSSITCYAQSGPYRIFSDLQYLVFYVLAPALTMLIFGLATLRNLRQTHRQTLTQLNLEQNGITDKGAYYLADVFRAKRKLTKLHLGANEITERGMNYLADALRNNRTLIRLDLNSNQIADKGMKHIADGLRNNTKLIELDLESNKISDKGAQRLTDALRVNKTLTKLNIGSNKIANKGMQHIATLLRINKTITRLDLSGNQITQNGIEQLAAALHNNMNLTELNLWCNPIMDEGVQYLANALANNNRTITKLGLERSEITEQGIKHLTLALYSNTSLTQLSLWGNQIGDKGAQYLAESLFVNKV